MDAMLVCVYVDIVDLRALAVVLSVPRTLGNITLNDVKCWGS